MLFFLAEDVFEETTSGGIVVAEPLDDFGVGGDGDTFRYEILGEHRDQISAVVVEGVASAGEAGLPRVSGL